jgi:hypothetical protein
MTSANSRHVSNRWKVAFPAAVELVFENRRDKQMTNRQKELLSGSAAIIFFTTLSSVTAVATALLPFALQS